MERTAEKKRIVRSYARQELARRDFWSFCMYYDAAFFKQRPFLKNVADAFQRIERGEIKSLSVSMPPRAGKSYITSLFCAWTLGRNPSESVMRNTCTIRLYEKFSYDVRSIIRSEAFFEVFGLGLADDKKNLNGWNVKGAKMVSYFGAGVGGTIIGFGASKLAITDDLYRGLEDALSDTRNDKIHQWKEATHDSRFESGCARIDIGTRWSINDVIGRQMEDNVYDLSIVIPALDPDGKSFCEAVMTTEEYQYKKLKTSKAVWLAEYMQQPVDMEGRLFHNLMEISEADFKLVQDEVIGHVAYIDVADQGNDYTAMAVAAITKDKIYITDIIYSTHNTDITIPQCAAILSNRKVSYCRVESNAMGAMFARALQREVKSTKILAVANQQNKMTRIIMQSVFIMQNFVFVRSEKPEYMQFKDNILSFSKEGKNRNDDAPDCVAGLAMFIRSMFRQFQ